MRWLKDYTMRLVLVGLVAVIMLNRSVQADFIFGEPVILEAPVNSSSHEGFTSISADGLELYFGSNRPGGLGDDDIWFTTRMTKDDAWGEPANLGPMINSSTWDVSPSLSGDGLTLYFASGQSGGYGNGDIWVTRRATRSDAWGPLENLGPPVNTSGDESFVAISSDSLELCLGEYSPVRPGGVGKGDLWMTRRPTVSDPWDTPQNLGPTVNSSERDEMPSLSADGLMLLFTSRRLGGYGARDIWVTMRATTKDPWREPVNPGPPINTSAFDQSASVSADGRTLYFTSWRSSKYGGLNLWQASIDPVVDFNGDGNVDCIDICDMVDNWGTDNSLYDIGPMPWGDGIVDVQDLIVLAEHLFEVVPPAGPVE
jgi:hypothetical protein